MITILQINGQNKEVEQGFTVSQVADDTLGSTTVVCYDTSGKPYAPFTAAKLLLGATILNFAVGSDNVIPADKQGLWKHTVLLTEPTKILEKFVVQSAILTNTTITAKEQVLRLLQNVELAITDEAKAVSFSLQTATAELLNSEYAEEVKIGGGTLREVLDDILSAFDCRATATYTWGDTLAVQIGHISLTDYKTAADFSKVTINKSNNVDSFCGGIYSDVKNAIGAETVREVNTLKARAGTATTENAEFLFSFPVEYITKAALTISKNVAFGKYVAQTWTPVKIVENMGDYEIDFSEWFVDSEYYNTLTEIEKNKYMAYTRGQTEQAIVSSYKYFLVSIANYENVLQSALLAWAAKQFPETDFSDLSARFSNTTTLWLPAYGDVFDIIFAIDYAPIIDTTIELNKPRANDVEKRLRIIANQNTASPDLYRFGNNLCGKLLRLGNDDVAWDGVATSYNDLLPLLGKIDDLIIWKREFAVWDDFLEVRYFLTESYNNLNRKIGVNSEIRLFAIPLTGQETVLPIRAALNFGSAIRWESEKKENPTISSFAIESVLKRLFGENGTAKVGYLAADVTIPNDEGWEDVRYVLPTANFGAGLSSVFSAKFYDNYSAGFSVTENKKIFEWIGGKKVAYNPYVDENGEFEGLGLTLGNSLTFIGQTPEQRAATIKKLPAFNSVFTFNNELTKRRWLNYNKDREQAIAVNYFIDFETTENEFALGTAFAADNALVSDSGAKLSVWISKTKYEKLDITRCKGRNYWQGNQIKVSDVFEYFIDFATKRAILKVKVNDLTNALIADGYTAFAIGDEFGRLYIALNDRNTNCYLWG